MGLEWPQRLADAVTAFSLPGGCLICGQLLVHAGRLPVCAWCLASIRPLTKLVCDGCGRPLAAAHADGGARLLCQLCRRGVYAFERARSYAAYDDTMVQAIILLKHRGVRSLGGWFAARLVEIADCDSEVFAVNVVMPVPLHESRRRQRGYNQAELIARPLARRLRLPLRTDFLVRTKPRPEKLKLTRRERWQTVRGAYATGPRCRVDKQHVLLVDDVFTTGATLDACARALLKAGAARVAGVTVARVVPGLIPQAAGRASNGVSANAAGRE